ncbi:hypothetical protein [Isobaculum melis]|uniref:Uncharacterized protein n=1 Tax=Isobaculum melis TaxID=142588 RepID=A0A1H9PSQ3_9LACT|nr:hypothetical protein [Isobaculum melis]SER50613.1 hypothetical protein SAMN04488559_10180 [Isobaculum melis]
MNLIHDYEITTYHINFEKETLVIAIQNREYKKQIVFKGFFAYQFAKVIPYSIILDLEEHSLEDFYKYNQSLFEQKEKVNWPVKYHSPLELRQILDDKELKYYSIAASYGLNGWVLARNCEVVSIGNTV